MVALKGGKNLFLRYVCMSLPQAVQASARKN
jgi:hypothetical protein